MIFHFPKSCGSNPNLYWLQNPEFFLFEQSLQHMWFDILGGDTFTDTLELRSVLFVNGTRRSGGDGGCVFI